MLNEKGTNLEPILRALDITSLTGSLSPSIFLKSAGKSEPRLSSDHCFAASCINGPAFLDIYSFGLVTNVSISLPCLSKWVNILCSGFSGSNNSIPNDFSTDLYKGVKSTEPSIKPSPISYSQGYSLSPFSGSPKASYIAFAATVDKANRAIYD